MVPLNSCVTELGNMWTTGSPGLEVVLTHWRKAQEERQPAWGDSGVSGYLSPNLIIAMETDLYYIRAEMFSYGSHWSF